MCKVAYLQSEPKELSADSAFVFGKWTGVALMRNLSISRLDLQATVMAV